MTDQTVTERLAPVGTVKPVVGTETQPYTYVAIQVQIGDRDGIEFRREFDTGNVEDIKMILSDLALAVDRYLDG